MNEPGARRRMNGVERHVAGVFAAWLLAGAAGAEVAEMPAAGGPSSVARPVNGMSMGMVERRFGAPLRRLPAVGDPPITRWVYDGYTVYFERRLTLTSVVHRPR